MGGGKYQETPIVEVPVMPEDNTESIRQEMEELESARRRAVTRRRHRRLSGTGGAGVSGTADIRNKTLG